MSGRRLRSFRSLLLAAGLLLGVGPLGALDPSADPAVTGSILLPGRLPWGPSALPTGEILAPCEDQTLRVIGADSQVTASWQASSRISGPVTVAPRGPVQRLAVPQLSGRVDLLVWDGLTRTLAGDTALNHRSETAATAWGSTGFLAAAWQDGHVQAWAPWNPLVWSVDLDFAARRLLVDDGLGTYVFGVGQVVLLDGRGREKGRWSFPGEPRGVLQTVGGELYVWTGSGLWHQGNDGGAFTLADPSATILGVAVDRLDRLTVTDAAGLHRYTPEGRALADLPLPRPPRTAAVVDDRGRFLVGTDRGLELWTYDGRLLDTLGPGPPASSPLLLPQGTIAWSGADWRVWQAEGFRLPPFGWAQDGGGPGRPFTARRPASVAARSPLWTPDKEFGFFYELASSGDEAQQRRALDQLPLDRPWASLILIKVARSGLIDLIVDYNRVTNNWPPNRMRAFGLLAQVAGPEDRDELLELLSKEFDPTVAAQGLRAAARTGWDGDGRLMRLTAAVQQRMKKEAVVADAAVDAARYLWQLNGRATDPVLFELTAAVFQGPYPRTVKTRAQTLFQELAASSP